VRVLRITKYGWREVLIATLSAGALCALLAWVFWPAVVLPVLAWAGILAFFREPGHTSPSQPTLLVSPADGRVTDISEVGPESALGCDGTRIGIFMSLLDVHVNFSPADATVERIVRTPGAFLDARHAEAPDRNAAATIHMVYEYNGREYRLIVRQVAGLIARRIVTDLSPGQRVRRSQRIGMVKFGSRLELWVPRELPGRLCVRIGSRVHGGQSALYEVTDG